MLPCALCTGCVRRREQSHLFAPVRWCKWGNLKQRLNKASWYRGVSRSVTLAERLVLGKARRHCCPWIVFLFVFFRWAASDVKVNVVTVCYITPTQWFSRAAQRLVFVFVFTITLLLILSHHVIVPGIKRDSFLFLTLLIWVRAHFWEMEKLKMSFRYIQNQNIKR